MAPEKSLPVDIVSADQLAKVMAGMKTGKKENPNRWSRRSPRHAGGRHRRQDHRKAAGHDRTSPPPQPKRGKAGRKKPDPPKWSRRSRRRRQSRTTRSPRSSRSPKQSRRKRRSRSQSRSKAAKPAEPSKPKTERVFDQSKIAALLDKREPTRQAATGDTLNSKPRSASPKASRRTIPRPGAPCSSPRSTVLERALRRDRRSKSEGRSSTQAEARRTVERSRYRKTSRRHPISASIGKRPPRDH